VIFGVVGDVHGNFSALARILARHSEIPFWLCVGDLASVHGSYPEPSAPLYWIKGNNEAFDRVDAFRDGAEVISNLHFIPNGTCVQVGPISVGGVGGTFAPTWYETPAAALPRNPKDDKRRHFVREEVDAGKALGHVDVLLTHEAPRPFWVTLPRPARQSPRGGDAGSTATAPARTWRRDVGKAAIAELADALQPRLHCFGHHHVSAAFERNGIPTICVDRVNRGYLLVDSGSFAWETHATGA
jgi:Icc-related predicted phosphoesterase